MTAMDTALPQGTGGLQRILGVGFGVAIGVGSMIGSGILRTPSLIAAEVPDGAIIMALWVVGGLHAALGANVYAELATSVPKAGGAYVYAHRAFGDVTGLIVGWSDYLTFIAGTAAASVSFAEFLTLLWPDAAPYRIAVAVTLQVVLYGANMIGVRQGRALQESTSLMKAALLLVFAAAAIAATWGPRPAMAVGPSPAFGLGAIVAAYNMVLGAYGGWTAPAYFSEETRRPSRDVPRALAVGLLTTCLLYVFVNAALLYGLGVDGLGHSLLPFKAILDRIGGTAPGVLFALGAMITVASLANSQIMGGSRVMLALSRDGLVPGALRRVNRGGSPGVALLAGAAVSITLAATGSFAIVFGLIGMLDTLGDLIVTAALLVLRRREPSLPRPYRAWGYPWLPLLVLAINTSLLVLFAGADTAGMLFAAALSALCVPYALIARRARLAQARG